MTQTDRSYTLIELVDILVRSTTKKQRVKLIDVLAQMLNRRWTHAARGKNYEAVQVAWQDVQMLEDLITELEKR